MEKEAFRKQTERVGLGRKVKRGDAWFPLSVGRTYYNSLNQYCVEVTRTADQDIEHNFEYGKPVVFWTVDEPTTATPAAQGGVRYFNFTGTVSYVDGDRMVVTIPEGHAFDLQGSTKPIGVQLFFDETSYRCMFEALDRVMKAKNGRLAYLRDLFYTNMKPQTLSFEPMRFPWLNTTQEHAVNEVLRAKDVMVVHGPPGTGKTTTLVEAIHETLLRESQVMVCAQSNAAVDWICGKLIDRGVPVLRVGNPARVDDKVLSATYERQFEAHPDYPELWGVRKAIREVSAGRRRMSRADASALSNRLHNLRRRAVELEVKIQVEIFEGARVVASTLVGSDNAVLKGRRFTTLYIDEAGQALEAACWIAIRKANRVIFAGDHCQLPPTVKSVEAERAGLSRSLMESVVDKCRSAVELLTVQYRMNEAIMRFSSDWFYGGRLQAAEEVKCRGILDFDSPVEWLDTSEMDFSEKYVSATGGRVNPDEGEFMLDSLEAYIKRIGEKRVEDENLDFAVISPYKAQVSWLRRNAKKRNVLRRLKGKIAINTIDGFQGQERDVVFISLVRSNDDGKIGFLSDLRRMNVAMTRARMKLVIIGSAATLTRHPFYEKLFLSQKKENGVKKVSEISGGESMCCEKS